MGSIKIHHAFWVISTIFLSISSPSSFALIIHDHHDPVSLASYLHNYTRSLITKARTGVLHKVDLPSNFSGMELSFVKLRSSQFWAKGSQLDPHFDIPPRIIASPYAKRLEILYENLGNWSSHYYNLPGFSFLAPVVGFSLYNASSTDEMLNLKLYGRPITVNFTNILIAGQVRNIHHRAKCARFQANGRVVLSEMASDYVCSSHHQGHFTIVERRTHHPRPPYPKKKRRKRKTDIWKWWVIGFGAGLVGILLIGMLGFLVSQVWFLRRIRLMEKKADKSEALSTRWVGESRMPFAYMTRTQATLENDYGDDP